MSWTTEKTIDRSYAAWKRGDLDRAIEKLTEIHDREPGLVEAVYPLARALHERGESARALKLLDAGLASPGAPRGGRIHRALINYDLGDDASLADDLAALGKQNHSVSALNALVTARRGNWTEAEFPQTAFWTSETAGRLLAILEKLHAESNSPAEDQFHHRLFCDPERKTSAPGGKKSDWLRNDWAQALDHAFTTRDFASFIALQDAVPKPIRKHLEWNIYAYAHYANSHPEKALKVIAEIEAREQPIVDYPFVAGLCHVRAGNHQNASFQFVRAANRDDVQINEILHRLAGELDIEFKVLEIA